MNIYTRTGDKGSTGLFGSGRVPKNHPRVEAYGAVDELNAAIGFARALATTSEADRQLDSILKDVQNDLFVLGADLGTPPESRAKPMRVHSDRISELEQTIDRLDAQLPELKNFILPAGSTLTSSLHVARTIARRAERRVVAASETESISPEAITYLNRLSDLIFVLARWIQYTSGGQDVIWDPLQ